MGGGRSSDNDAAAASVAKIHSATAAKIGPMPRRSPRLRRLPALAALCSLAALAPAQQSQDLQSSLRYGREALAAGRHDEAQRHFLYALARSTRPAELIELLLENAQGDADARILWAHELYAEAADASGRLKTQGGLKDLLPPDDPFPARVATARAKAVRELLRLRGQRGRAKDVGSLLAVQWLEDLARQLAAPSPALRKAHGADTSAEIEVGQRVWEVVVQELQRIVRAALGSGDPVTAVRAARVLRGLAAQAGFKDLEGPEPMDMASGAQTAGEGLGRGRASLLGREGGPLRIEQLEEMSFDQQRAFTLAHASFGDPGVSFSPRDRYRVETSCGWETLIGSATTVELHHDRLVKWYGQDPFLERQGTLRVVPESHGLEMEGAGFWWVGGFQGGDTTTLKLTIGTIPGLGRGITHELTHRFDGGVYGGLPAWLAEGRAVWTASAYGSMYDEDFVADHASFGTQTGTRQKGYGGREKLEELISGEIEEYRDNYVAGYSLYLFLNTWSGVEPEEDEEGYGEWSGEPLFHDRLMAFMEGDRRRRGDPVKVFATYFADGKDGRPDGMQAFAEEFDRFLAGFWWREPADWRDERYTQATPPGDPAPTVMDEPTWSWERHRAEPWFGQEQARMAGELCAELGRHREAGFAFYWSLGVDEPSPGTLDLFVEELEKDGEREAAWMLRHWERYRAPARHEGPEQEAPFLDKTPSTRALASTWAEAARSYLAAGQRVAAEAMAAQHDRLAAAVGLPPLELGDGGREQRGDALREAREAGLLHPFVAPPRLLGLDGWGEDGLTGHEDRRVEGLWFAEPDGDLHVGRSEPRQGTDTMDREAHWRDAFALGEAWMEPGRYRLSAQVEFTTSYVSAGVVVGYTRRDRNVRFGFSGGDQKFAVGETDESRGLDSFSWSLDGLYARRGAVTGHHAFGAERNTFELELLVDGPTAELRLDGATAGWVTTVDGSPIQGRIGFYTSHGAVRVRTPTVQRLDRDRWASGGVASGQGLHPFKPGAPSWSELVQRPVSGLELRPSGTVLLWFPDQTPEKLAEMQPDEWSERVTQVLDKLAEDFEFEGPSQGVVAVLPPSFPAEAAGPLREKYAEAFPGGFRLQRHDRPGELEESDWTIQGWTTPTLAFIDPAGILQHYEKVKRYRTGLSKEVLRWMALHQDHSRPGQAGAFE